MLLEDKCINPMQEIIIAGYGGISSIWNFLAFTVLLLVNHFLVLGDFSMHVQNLMPLYMQIVFYLTSPCFCR